MADVEIPLCAIAAIFSVQIEEPTRAELRGLLQKFVYFAPGPRPQILPEHGIGQAAAKPRLMRVVFPGPRLPDREQFVLVVILLDVLGWSSRK